MAITINSGAVYLGELGPGGSGSSYSDYVPGGVTCYTRRERAIRIRNNAGNNLFIPNSTQAEKNSVYYNLSLNCTVHRRADQYIANGKLYCNEFSGSTWCYDGYPGGDQGSLPACTSGFTDEGAVGVWVPDFNAGGRNFKLGSFYNETTTNHHGDVPWMIFIQQSWTYWCPDGWPYQWLMIRQCSLA